jgi:hypothetical protein
MSCQPGYTQKIEVNRLIGTYRKLGSDLGPFAAENHVFGPNITQRQPKRDNNLANRLLFRDQLKPGLVQTPRKPIEST